MDATITAPVRAPAPEPAMSKPRPSAPAEKTRSETTGINVWYGCPNTTTMRFIAINAMMGGLERT